MSLGARLHVTYEDDISRTRLSLPRRYTLTHSDMTGELLLTIGADYNNKQIGGWYTRLMRDEVLAEWQKEKGGYSLHLYCHVSGGIVFGTAGMRYGIFRQHMPLVLRAFHEGDAPLYERQSGLNQTNVIVHFFAWQKRYRRIEPWGRIGDYE
jgi:hypothetical protein